MTDNIFHFKLAGQIQPYTRTHRGAKYYAKNTAAVKYHRSKENVADQISMDMLVNKLEMLPPSTPLFASLFYVVPKGLYKFDLDNILKAVLDAAEGYAFKNDLWIKRVLFLDKSLTTRKNDYFCSFIVGLFSEINSLDYFAQYRQTAEMHFASYDMSLLSSK